MSTILTREQLTPEQCERLDAEPKRPFWRVMCNEFEFLADPYSAPVERARPEQFKVGDLLVTAEAGETRHDKRLYRVAGESFIHKEHFRWTVVLNELVLQLPVEEQAD